MSRRAKYQFDKAIETKLNQFKTYLQKLGNSDNTIRQKCNYVAYFLNWLESENLQTVETTYNDMLNFIDYCHLEGLSKRHINTVLRAIRNLYECQRRQGLITLNPALNLYLKGIKQKLPSNIIDYAELVELHASYTDKNKRDKRNKAMLGLLIYQGITTEELHYLELEHLNLQQGKIRITGNRKRKGRTLELNPCQILELYEYSRHVRPTINTGNSPQLFVSIEGNEQLKNTLHHMFRGIRKEHPNIRNPKQIRASVITYWLKNHNLRQVQYMAGHKYVSSTERYKLNNLDTLKSKLEMHHPLQGTKTKY